MNGFLTFLLLISFVVSDSLSSTMREGNDIASAELEEKRIESRRHLPIFPKSRIKFVVTPPPYNNKVYTHYPREKIMTKMPMTHIDPKTKPMNAETSQLVSRKPLMRSTTITIPLSANGKFQSIEDNVEHSTRGSNKQERRRRINIRTQTLDSTQSTEHPAEVHLNEESRVNTKSRSYINDSIDRENKAHRNVKRIMNTDKISSEEAQDRDEFIFLQNNNEKRKSHELVEDNRQDVDNIETTAVFKARDVRFKRNNNIIEEENMATTVSSLRYTRQDRRLTQYILFKNVNS